MKKILGHLSVLLWLLIGVIIVGSIYFSTALWGMNLVIGLLFILFSFFLYQKQKNFLLFLTESSVKQNKIYKRMIFYEIFSRFFSLLFTLVIFSGVTHRVFFEHFSVFG